MREKGMRGAICEPARSESTVVGKGTTEEGVGSSPMPRGRLGSICG